MTIAVTGGTGFIGDYVVNELLQRNYSVIVTGTNINKARQKEWFSRVDFVELNIDEPCTEETLAKIVSADKLIHLAWSGLPNYNQLFHFEKNLPEQYSFLKSIVERGLTDITVTGTCFEYGMVNGCLHEGMQTNPSNPYALAKDTLHKFLIQLSSEKKFTLKWVRLFYMHGKGQSGKSLMGQLEKAMEQKDAVFNMSAGEQLRDFLPVTEVSKNIVRIALHETFSGTVNCCSGKPVSVRTLVEAYIKDKHPINLNLGFYAYPDYEPMAFWGDDTKLRKILSA